MSGSYDFYIMKLFDRAYRGVFLYDYRFGSLRAYCKIKQAEYCSNKAGAVDFIYECFHAFELIPEFRDIQLCRCMSLTDKPSVLTELEFRLMELVISK